MLPPLKHSMQKFAFNVKELTGLTGVDLVAVAMDVEWDNNLRHNQFINRGDILPQSCVVPIWYSYIF